MTHVAEPPATAEGRATERERVNHWINGAPVAGSSGRSGPVYNPATGRVAREVDFASADEVDRAVAAAHEEGIGGVLRVDAEREQQRIERDLREPCRREGVASLAIRHADDVDAGRHAAEEVGDVSHCAGAG